MTTTRQMRMFVGTGTLVGAALLAVVLVAQQPQPQPQQQPQQQQPAPPSGAAQGSAPPAGRQGGRGGFGGIQIQPGEECPPGTTEVRPRSCQAPSMPPPSIVDYRPESTLVTPVHLVPKAKFPAIDYHGHPQRLLGAADGVTSLVTSLDSLNV